MNICWGEIRLRLFEVKHPKIDKDQAGLCCGLPQPEKQQQPQQNKNSVEIEAT